MDRPVVLVVDDERANAELCREALQLEGYEVVTAYGTKEAVAIIASREVDVIVCDVQMPYNGQRVFEFLLQKYPELAGHFIFVTGSPTKKAEIEIAGHKSPCLLKPFTIRTLLDAMRIAMG
jgi:CheY-like chemotaxis protein